MLPCIARTVFLFMQKEFKKKKKKQTQRGVVEEGGDLENNPAAGGGVRVVGAALGKWTRCSTKPLGSMRRLFKEEPITEGERMHNA